MSPEEFKKRTKAYALRIIRLVLSLDSSQVTHAMGGQLLRAGTSVGANYRSACRARSRADFISKMGVVEEECDESLYWMELMIDAAIVKQALLTDLIKEGNEILALVVASRKTARSKR
jgi:four helix bundle protein